MPNIIMTREKITNVALFGASGNLGGHILNALVKESFTVTLICRPESTLEASSLVEDRYLSQITTIRIPLDEPNLVSALSGQDAVIASIARGGAIGTQRVIIDAAVKAGVKRFIPSEFGADTLSDGLLERVPLMKEKRKILGYLQETCKENPWFTWTGISTAAFLDWGLETGFLGFDFKNHTANIYSGGTKAFNATSRSTIGEAVAASLQNPATENRYLHVADVTTCQNEIWAALQRKSSEHWTVVEKDVAEEHALGAVLWEKGNIPGAARQWLIGNLYGSGYGTVAKTLDNEMLGLKAKTLEDVVGRLSIFG